VIGTVVCLHAALWAKLFAGADNGWPHSTLQYY